MDEGAPEGIAEGDPEGISEGVPDGIVEGDPEEGAMVILRLGFSGSSSLGIQ